MSFVQRKHSRCYKNLQILKYSVLHKNADLCMRESLMPFLFLLCRKRTEEMLKNAREEQVRNKEHFLAVQAARDRAEFERVLV